MHNRNFGKKIRISLIIAVFVVLMAFIGYKAIKIVAFPIEYEEIITRYSQQYGLREELVCAVIHAESTFRPNIVSKKGASGLMQLMKSTADWGALEIGIIGYDYSNIFDPELNIQLGCWYLAKLIDQFGSEKTALAAYNAGSGNVNGWLEIKEYSQDGISLDYIPFTETRNYTKKIDRNEKIYFVLFKINKIIK